MSLIAVDPGVSGGIAFLRDGSTYAVSMPSSFRDIRDTLDGMNQTDSTLYIEDLPKFCGPKIPGSRMAPLWENYGAIQMWATARDVKMVMIPPAQWQKFFNLGKARDCKNKGEWKRKLKEEAERRFPGISITLKTADALLLLEYAKETQFDRVIARIINKKETKNELHH